MRIDFVSFLDPEHYGGGGEQVSRRLIAAGRARGHDIAITSLRPRRDDRPGRGPAELTLFTDLFNHAHSFRSLGAWRAFGARFLEAAMAKGPFVHLTNAYVDICNLPYLPCSGAAAEPCPHKAALSWPRRVLMRDFGQGCFGRDPLVRRLFTEAALNVFVSPLHKRITETVLGVGLQRTHILPPLIDTTRFYNRQVERDIDYLFVGVIGEAKGLAEMRERFAGTDIHLIGQLAPGVTLDFGRHVGYVPYEEVPAWMNRARNFVFLPRWPEPQGRVVAEAALCGCTIIGNDNVGALSFDFDLADPARYRGIEDAFWQTLESLT